MIIAIDGPAGSGKSTVARLAAKHLGFSYIDSGAFYRACTLRLLRENVSLDNSESVAEVLRRIKIRAEKCPEGNRLFLDDEDVTEEIRSEEVTASVSRVSALSEVRDRVTSQLRGVAVAQSVVVEGRDIGTVVFPDADLKIYLSASARARARRRYDELIKAGVETSLEKITRNLAERDDLDSTRKLAPLQAASDATKLDTTDMSIEEVVQFIVNQTHEMRTRQSKP